MMASQSKTLESMRVAELRILLSKNHLPVKGKKAELVKRYVSKNNSQFRLKIIIG